MRQLQCIQGLHLQPRQRALGAPRLLIRVLFEGPETVIHAEGPERILHTCRAFAERPGRTVPRHGVVAEGFDRLLVHPGEEVPRLVVLARMAETEPDVLAEPLARAGDLEAAILPAAGP